MQGTKRGTIR